MIPFRDAYAQSCKDLGIEVNRPLIERLTPVQGDGENFRTRAEETSVETFALATPYSRTLDLSGQSISGKMMAAISQALKLTADSSIFVNVLLSDCLIGDDGCTVLTQGLRQNDSVQLLNLRGCNIRADGTIALSQYLKLTSKLQWLSLEWNSIGIFEVGVGALSEALAMNTSLLHLDLRNNKLGPNNCVTITESLKHNVTLRSLDLRWNSLGFIGGKALVEMLNRNQSLVELQVEGSDIPDDMMQSIMLALERNKQMYEFASKERYVQSVEEQIQPVPDLVDMQRLKTDVQILQQKLTASENARQAAESKLLDLETKVGQERKTESKALADMLHKQLSFQAQTDSQSSEHVQHLNAIKTQLLESESKRLAQEITIEQLETSNKKLTSQLAQYQQQILLVQEEAEQEVKILLDQLDRQKSTMNNYNTQIQQQAVQSQPASVAPVQQSTPQSVKQEPAVKIKAEVLTQHDDSELQTEVATLKAQLKRRTQQIDQLQIQLDEQQEHDAKVESQLKTLRVQEQSLQDQLSELQSKYNKVSAQFKAAKQDEVQRAKSLQRAIAGYVKSIEMNS